MTAMCFDKCNACDHVHYGVEGSYRCPKCTCSDRHECETTDCAKASA